MWSYVCVNVAVDVIVDVIAFSLIVALAHLEMRSVKAFDHDVHPSTRKKKGSMEIFTGVRLSMSSSVCVAKFAFRR